MEQKLTNEEIAKVFGMYLGQRVYLPNDDETLILTGSSIFSNTTEMAESEDSVDTSYCDFDVAKLLLTPLSKISDEDVLELCKLYSPEIYGDYRFKKWYIEQNGTKSDTWNTIEIKRQSDTYCFELDKIDGEMRLYDEEMIDSASVNHYYQQWYFMKGYAVPLFFGIDHWANGKTAIELGIALDKTTIE